VSRYIEGYYCKDDNSIEGIKNESLRKALSAISDSYPWGITADEISKRTDIPGDTVYGSLKILENSGFIKREKNKPGRGRPKGSADTPDQSRAFKFHVENRNFVLNEGEAYQFAPGYTKYNPEFLYAWNVLLEESEQNEIYLILMRLLRRVMTRITSSNDPILKQITPMIESIRGGERISMQCKYCGVNHEARDFIRAVLLRTLDQFERTPEFVGFFTEQEFISRDSYENHDLLNRTPKQKSKTKEEAKEWLDSLAPDAKETAESILKQGMSIERLKWRVDKLTGEPYFDEQLGDYAKVDELEAFSIIADEERKQRDYETESPELQTQQRPMEAASDVLTHPTKKMVKVEQIQAKGGIKVTLHKVEFTVDYTAAFLTVEKTGNNLWEISFYDGESKAVQGERQFNYTSRGPNYKKIRRTIPYGIKEYGVVKFEAVDYNENSINFEFAFNMFGSHYVFLFELQIPK